MQKHSGDFLFLVEQATKAPSGHNTQPWLFKINRDSIEIHPNFEKSLPVVDPDNRELFISLGCAIENLCIAASSKGYEAKVSSAEKGIVTIHLPENKLVKQNPLFEQMAGRQSNRSVYKGEIISREIVSKLDEVALEEGVNRYFFQNGSDEFRALADLVTKGNTIQMQDQEFIEELSSWMRFNRKHSLQTQDGLSYAVFGVPNLPLFIVKPIMSAYLNAKKQNKGDVKKMQSSSHLVLFTATSDSVDQWIRLGRALERFLLKITEFKIAHAFLNQPVEVKRLSEEIKKALNIHEKPNILLRIGYGKTAAYSLRKRVEEVILSE